jgi:hypothetical protein
MIGLFKTIKTNRKGVIHSSWRNVESQLKLDFSRYFKWFRSSNGIVDNSNLLVRMLMALDLDVSLSYGEYLVSITDKWEDLNNHFETTSFSDKGIVFDNIIATKNVALVTHLDGGTKGDWKEMVPLKFISTKSTSLQFKDLAKDYVTDDDYVTHMSLDIMEFALMYRGWKINKSSRDLDTGIANFIYSYVIPNTMTSLYNLSIINRYFMIDLDNDDVRTHGQFTIKSRYNLVDRFITDNRDYLLKQVETYDFYLASIPVYKSTASSALLLDFQQMGLNLLTFSVASRVRVFSNIRDYFDNGTGNVNYINNDILNEVWLKTTIVNSNKTMLKSKIVDDECRILIDMIQRSKK